MGLKSIFNAITQLLFLCWFKWNTLCEFNSKNKIILMLKKKKEQDYPFTFSAVKMSRKIQIKWTICFFANSLYIYIEKYIVTFLKSRNLKYILILLYICPLLKIHLALLMQQSVIQMVQQIRSISPSSCIQLL